MDLINWAELLKESCGLDTLYGHICRGILLPYTCAQRRGVELPFRTPPDYLPPSRRRRMAREVSLGKRPPWSRLSLPNRCPRTLWGPSRAPAPFPRDSTGPNRARGRQAWRATTVSSTPASVLDTSSIEKKGKKELCTPPTTRNGPRGTATPTVTHAVTRRPSPAARAKGKWRSSGLRA